MTRLSAADRCAAIGVALAALLLCGGVHYLFERPAPAAVVSVTETERPHLP